MELKDKIIVLTGACGGIGSELAKVLSNEGAKLILIDVNEEMLKNLISRLTGEHRYIISDFSNRLGLYKVVEEVKSFGLNIDILINNAGIGVYKSLKDVTFEEFEQSFYINIFAPMILSKELITLMKGRGIVFNMGSLSGKRTLPNRISYNASKFSLRGFSLSLSEELRDSNISSVLLSLGSTFTEFGGVSLAEKEKMKLSGKAYFTTEYVANKIKELLMLDSLEDEYVLTPDGNT